MSDLFGHQETPPRFVDIRNQRPAVADEKAELTLVLNRLCKTVPASINGASVNVVREYKAVLKRAQKVLASKSSSRQELSSAINSLQRF